MWGRCLWKALKLTARTSFLFLLPVNFYVCFMTNLTIYSQMCLDLNNKQNVTKIKLVNTGCNFNFSVSKGFFRVNRNRNSHLCSFDLFLVYMSKKGVWICFLDLKSVGVMNEFVAIDRYSNDQSCRTFKTFSGNFKHMYHVILRALQL